MALADLGAGKPLLAVAAIANPEAFFAMLRAQGLPLAKTIALPDHADFSRWAGNADGAWTVLCTEKDAVKLWAREPAALAVPLDFEPEGAFWQALAIRLEPLLKP